jgi:four helix bundle protein
VYLLTDQFPPREIYGLTSQMRRAVTSIAANIAEGNARDSTKDYLRHLAIAQGSLAELETFLVLAEQLRYCTGDVVAELMTQCQEEGRMLNGLQTRLRAKLTPDP